MNNSRISIESASDASEQIKERLRSEESRLLTIIESLESIQESKAWSSLKTEVFDNLVNVLEKDLKTEAEQNDPNTNKLNRIAGELKWARKFSDLSRFEKEKRVELQNIRLQLYGKESE